MEQSILTSTKKILNISPDDPSFDLDIIMHINSALSHLFQLGVGPPAGLAIEDASIEWTALGIEELPILNQLKTCVFLRVRLLFDPPQMWHVMAAMEKQLLECDTRLSILREETAWVDPRPPDVLVVDGGYPSDYR